MSLLAPEEITRRRYGAYAIDANRVRNRGASTDTTFTATVAPASWRQLQSLPEGQRSLRSIRVITHTELRGEQQHDGLPADEVIRGGFTYRVASVAEHPALGGLQQNWDALCVQVQTKTPAGT